MLLMCNMWILWLTLLCVGVQIPLTGPNAVVGRAFVVHELADDLGKGKSFIFLIDVFSIQMNCLGNILWFSSSFLLVYIQVVTNLVSPLEMQADDLLVV